MTDTEAAFFYLVRKAIGTSDGLMPPDNVNWREVYRLSISHNLCAVACDGMLTMEPCPVEEDLRYEWLGQSMVKERQYYAHARVIADLAAFYRQHNIRMLLLKGYGLSLDYPRPDHRSPGDIDVYLFGEWQQADRAVTQDLGIKIDSGHEHHTVFCFENQVVENHYDIINTKNVRSSRWIERELKQLAIDQGSKLSLSGETIFLPSANFNALFLMRHLGQHFAGNEINLKQVLDWALFLKNHADKVEWDRIVPLWKSMGLYPFALSILSICSQYLGISVKQLSFGKKDEGTVNRVFEDILHPEFDKLKPNGFVPVLLFKTQRFFSNGWKRRLVYREGVWEQFFTGSIFHLTRFSTITD